jgi:hypothetical protein
MERPRSSMIADWVGEEYPPVKPNWIGPKATIMVHRKAEIAVSFITAADDIIIILSIRLDCRDPITPDPPTPLPPILYQLPVCRNGRLRSAAEDERPSSLPLSSRKLIFFTDYSALRIGC